MATARAKKTGSARARTTKATKTGAGRTNAKRGGGTTAKAGVRKKTSGGAPAKNPKKASAKPRPPLKPNKDGVVLLSGGNPQIAKGDGDGPVQAYITAMPGWSQKVGRDLDRIITNSVPNVHKAVKWNTPFYGVRGQGWIVAFHVFTKYVKVTFFDGALLRPPPPVESKDRNVRYYHVNEGEAVDEKQFASWVKQASALPGWNKA